MSSSASESSRHSSRSFWGRVFSIVGNCTLVIGLTIAASSIALSQQLKTRNYTVGSGMRGQEIEGILQLGSGSFLFLTQLGVSTYNGATWNSESSCAVKGQIPWRVALEQDDNAWVYAGTDCWRRTKNSQGEVSWALAVTAPIESAQSSFFTVLAGQGGQARLLIVDRSGMIHTHDGSSWSSIKVPAPPTGLTAAEIIQGRLILGSGEGLVELDLETGRSMLLSVQPQNLDVIGLTFFPSTGKLWTVSADGSIARIDGINSAQPKIELVARTPHFILPEGASSQHEQVLTTRRAPVMDFPCTADLEGGFYFGSRFQIFYFHPEIGFELVSERNGLSSSGMTSAMTDREGNIWIGSVRGANKITSRRIRFYSRVDGLLEDEVTAAIERADGTVILGHVGGLTIMGDRIEEILLSYGNIQERVMGFAEDEQGRLWFAGGLRGLGLLLDDGSVEFQTPESRESVISVLSRPGGEGLWVATERELLIYDEGTWIQLPILEGFGEFQIRNLGSAPAPGVYVATANMGVLYVSDREVKTWQSPNPMLNSTYSVLQQSTGEVWAATKGGLAVLNENGSLTLAPDLLVSRPIYSLVEDYAARLWFGSDEGVYCWDGEELERLGPADGLVGEEANRAGALLTRDGRVWMGSDRGVSIIDPRFATKLETIGPTVILETVEAGGESYDLNKAVKLDSSSRALLFKFSTVSFVDEDRVKFQKRLVGWDDEWSDAELNSKREFRYSYLPAGEYQLHVRAIDVRGRVSNVGTSALIEIEKPVWERPIFYASVSIVLLLILWAVIMFPIQRRYMARLKREVLQQNADLRQLEREKERHQRIESIGVLAGGIAHDFNNLLTTISGNASLLEDDTNEGGWKAAALRDIGEASNKAAVLAKKFLTFARGGSPIKESSEIGDVIRESVRFSLIGSNVEAEIETPSDLPVVDVDADQFSQVLNNLVINARHAMTSGGTLHISAVATKSSEGRQVVEIAVTDEGPGIAVEDVDRIFEPYFSTKPDGHGLGLATARSIIERHDGTLVVDQSTENGATFRITIPASDVVAAEMDEDLQDARIIAAELGAHVLVMDDQEAIRKIARSILMRSGCTVTEAKEGSEAVMLYKEALKSNGPFDVVVMDLTVPGGMGGIEATSLICSIDEQACVIATSGYTEGDTMSNYQDYGFVGRLSKPFNAAELRDVVTVAVMARRTV